MNTRRGVPRSALSAAAPVFLLVAALAPASRRGIAAPATRSRIDVDTLAGALAGALGGMANIDKIRTLHFAFEEVSFRSAPSNGIQTFQARMHLAGDEWLTSDGDDRVEIHSAIMQAPPTLEVLDAGPERVSVQVTVTASTQYVPVGRARTCAGSAADALCVNVPALYFDKVSPVVPPRAVLVARSANDSATVRESDSCGGIAAIAPGSGTGARFAVTVTPLHVGHCAIQFASDSPQGWMLVGDQGVPSGNSTGRLQGPDLEREISHVYWTTFAYLTASGLPGKVTATARQGAVEYRLDMAPDGGAPIEAYLNRKTFLPDSVQVGTDPDKMVIVPGDWRSVGGVRFPFDMTAMLLDSQMTFHYTFTTIEVNVPTPKDAFSQPKPAL